MDVLVVDDDRDFADSMRDMLILRRFTVRVACNIDEARVALAEREPDVLLCDLHLPPHTAHVFLRHVADEHPRVRRVLVTGAKPDEWSTLVDRGIVHATMTKPFPLCDVLGVMRA